MFVIQLNEELAIKRYVKDFDAIEKNNRKIILNITEAERQRIKKEIMRESAIIKTQTEAEQ